MASGEGTLLQAVIDAAAADVVLVVSNNSGSGAIERAMRHGIAARHLSSRTHPDAASLDDAFVAAFEEHGAEAVLLAGYNKLLGPRTLARYAGRVLNTHPAPLPEFGGRGMYGMRVHEAVLAAGLTESASSIHLVDEEYDHGEVVASRRVPVEPGDTPEKLRDRVMAAERALVVETLKSIELPIGGARHPHENERAGGRGAPGRWA